MALAINPIVMQVSMAGESSQAREISALIGATYDKPEQRVRTDPVVAVGNYAVASWTQGERGGRALLRRERGKWIIVLCAGALLRDADGLRQAGVPQNEARQLVQKLARAEVAVPAERRGKFDLFGTAEDARAGHQDQHDGHHHAGDAGDPSRKGGMR
jgi:hypothetical protein